MARSPLSASSDCLCGTAKRKVCALVWLIGTVHFTFTLVTEDFPTTPHAELSFRARHRLQCLSCFSKRRETNSTYPLGMWCRKPCKISSFVSSQNRHCWLLFKMARLNMQCLTGKGDSITARCAETVSVPVVAPGDTCLFRPIGSLVGSESESLANGCFQLHQVLPPQQLLVAICPALFFLHLRRTVFLGDLRRLLLLYRLLKFFV